MKKGRTAWLTVALGLLLLTLVLLLAHSRVHRTGGIVLPQVQTEDVESGPGESTGGLNVVEITPDTVQVAVSTLSRPMSYQRMQTVETFWSGGSGKESCRVSVNGGFTRIDRQLADNSLRHELISGNRAAIWYDDETEWTEISCDGYNGDAAQRMPTYETVRDLPSSRIKLAEYRTMDDGSPVIYVTTAPDDDGYAERFWISTETGLLTAAEREKDGELLYRFTADAPEAELPDKNSFVLPDGSHFTPVE